jgi:hypothetical protein
MFKFLETTKHFLSILHWTKKIQLVNSPSFESYESQSIQSKQPVTQVESNERKITFNDMHPEIEKVEDKKFVDQDLLKHRVALSEGSKKMEETSNKKYCL